MISPRVVTSKFSYAYLWWRDQSAANGRNIEWIRGSGWGGQCLNVIPKLAMVVVVTAGVYDFDGKGPQNLACDTVMDKSVLPAVFQPAKAATLAGSNPEASRSQSCGSAPLA